MERVVLAAWLMGLVALAGREMLAPTESSRAQVEDQTSISTGPLTVEAGLDQPALPGGWSTRRLVVQVTGADITPERVPTAYAVVVDTSGSMSGEPLQQAKDALDLFSKSLAPGDELAVVRFSSDAQVVVPLGPPEAAEMGAVHELRANGGTDLARGIDVGRQALETATGPTRILLLSDGRSSGADHIRTASEEAIAQGIVVSTAGVGVQVDDSTLQQVAVTSGGSYSFLDSPGSMAQWIEEEQERVARVVATHTRVLLPEHESLEVKRVFVRGSERSADGTTVLVGDIPAGETRKVVAEVRVRHDLPSGWAPVLTAEEPGSGRSWRAADPVSTVHVHNPREVLASTRHDLVELANTAESYELFQATTVAWRAGNTAAARQELERARAAAGRRAAETGTRSILQSGWMESMKRSMEGLMSTEALQTNFEEISSEMNKAI